MGYCLENDDEIGITNYVDSTRIEPVFGWGKIIKRERFPDGKSNIIVKGMGLARIIRFKSQEPFIIASVDKKENDFTYLETPEFKEVLEKILDLTTQHFRKMEVEDEFISDLIKIRTSEFPLDVIASILDLDSNYKQDILLNENPMDKANLLLFHLNKLLNEKNS